MSFNLILIFLWKNERSFINLEKPQDYLATFLLKISMEFGENKTSQ
jgi:hypothetical protein